MYVFVAVACFMLGFFAGQQSLRNIQQNSPIADPSGNHTRKDSSTGHVENLGTGRVQFTTYVTCDKKVIPFADAETFSRTDFSLEGGFIKTLWFPHAYEDNTRYYVLSNSDDCNSLVSLDKETFVQIGTSTYYRDKNDIYSYITGIDTNDLHPLHADTSTFEILRYGFARDKDYVYYPAGGDGTIGAIVKGADAGSFENLVGPYAKDKSQVYFVNQPSEGFAKVTTIEGADTKTFEIVRSGNGSASVAKDKNRVYFRDTEIAGLSPSTLRTFSLSPRLLADNLGVYYNGMLIPEIEASTFSIGTTTGEVTLASDIHHNYQITKDGSDAQLLSLKVISTH